MKIVKRLSADWASYDSVKSYLKSYLETNNKLKEQLKRFETWEAVRDQYERKKLSPGVYVLRIKPEAKKDSEEQPDLCADCDLQKEIHILHTIDERWGQTHLRCGSCRQVLKIGDKKEDFNVPNLRRVGGRH